MFLNSRTIDTVTLVIRSDLLAPYKEDLFEAILVNEEDQITEGSKSNIFFLKSNSTGGEVWTSPADGVLLGVR